MEITIGSVIDVTIGKHIISLFRKTHVEQFLPDISRYLSLDDLSRNDCIILCQVFEFKKPINSTKLFQYLYGGMACVPCENIIKLCHFIVNVEKAVLDGSFDETADYHTKIQFNTVDTKRLFPEWAKITKRNIGKMEVNCLFDMIFYSVNVGNDDKFFKCFANEIRNTPKNRIIARIIACYPNCTIIKIINSYFYFDNIYKDFLAGKKYEDVLKDDEHITENHFNVCHWIPKLYNYSRGHGVTHLNALTDMLFYCFHRDKHDDEYFRDVYYVNYFKNIDSQGMDHVSRMDNVSRMDAVPNIFAHRLKKLFRESECNNINDYVEIYYNFYEIYRMINDDGIVPDHPFTQPVYLEKINTDELLSEFQIDKNIMAKISKLVMFYINPQYRWIIGKYLFMTRTSYDNIDVMKTIGNCLKNRSDKQDILDAIDEALNTSSK